MKFRVILVTDPQTHKHTNKQTAAITIHCAAASPARSVITAFSSQSDSAGNHELRPILSDWDGSQFPELLNNKNINLNRRAHTGAFGTRAWTLNFSTDRRY